MKKTILSFLLVLTLLAGAFSAAPLPVSAARRVTEAQVIARLAEARSVWPDGEAYIDRLDDGCTLCYGFIRELFEYLFDAPLPRMWTVAAASFANEPENVTQVGHLDRGYSLGELETLLAGALPGDVLIASNGRTNHGMIVCSAEMGGAGFYVYDANWGRTASGAPILRAGSYWSAEELQSAKPTAVTLYRYVNYVKQSDLIPSGAQVHLETVCHYTTEQFADVSETDWYAGSVGEAYELGLMSGIEENMFDPDGGVSIAEVIAAASRLHSLYTRGEAEPDASAGGAWYQK